jgi:transcriptional regulator with XRE-family HTH domain
LTPHASGRHFLGSELRWWRQHKGLTLAQLASAIHVSPDLLTKIEKADRSASEDVLSRCDHALNTGGALGRLRTFVERQPVAHRYSLEQLPLVITALTQTVAATERF